MADNDSLEVLKLKKLIENKEKYISKIEDKASLSYKFTQNEILFLKHDILPLLSRNSGIQHFEFSKYASSKFTKALENKCNGLLLYYPIDDSYEDKPIIGIANPRANMNFGSIGAMEIYIDNMDGNGCKIQPINLSI